MTSRANHSLCPSPPHGRREGRVLACLSVAGIVLLSSACDKLPLFAPSQSTITLTAPLRVLSLNGSTEVTAVVLEQPGTPVQNGTTVRFTTSLGRVDPPEAQTRNGVATTTFYAGDTSGLADVRATSGAAGGGTGTAAGGAAAGGAAATTATNVIQFTIGAAAIDSVTIRGNPTSVSATGGSVEIAALVMGLNGRPVSGVSVAFNANHGTLSSTTATTDGNGEALVRLTTSVETIVTATAGAKTTATGVTITVLGSPVVTLTCQGTGTTGSSCAQVAGQPVSFSAARGTGTTAITNAVLDFGDGFSVSLGTLTSAATVTHTYNSAEAVTATLRASDANGQTTSASVAVTVTAKPPVGVTFSTASVGAVTAGSVLGTFVAAVTGAAATEIESYTWDFGDGSASVTTSGASTTHAYTRSGRIAVTVTVRTTDGRTGTGRTEIIVNAAPLGVTFSTASVGAVTAGSVLGTFVAAVTGAVATEIESYTWDFGDGSGSVTTSGASTNHVYSGSSHNGRNIVTVTVRTTDGRTATGRTEIIVSGL